ncbi:MAG TPA: DHH family phosphoesterase [bacterium]|nr:DHH family phosphoesterase [bacterium]HOL48792.1 DHH family phosphoesterase [bacterium]HPQ20024.1 DHH family phosphoesterase [bacterium]
MIFERNNYIKDEFIKILQELKDEQIIVLADYPDPDSIVSSILLKKIFSFKNIKSKIVYSLPISHQETLAMIKIFRFDEELIKVEKIESANNIWLVDGHGTQNFSLLNELKNQKIYGIIDHHPDAQKITANYKDIFIDASSTAALLISYIIDFLPELINTKEFNSKLFTAIIYAMRSDASKGLYFKEFDYKVASLIVNKINYDILNIIENQTYSFDTLLCFGEAINNMKIIGTDFVVSDVKYVKINNRDAIPQAAELLLKVDGINTVIVFGVIVNNDKIPIQINGSLRTISDKLDVNSCLKEIFGVDKKTLKPYGGGRNYKGGFSIPIEGYFQTIKDEESLNKFIEFIRIKIREDVENFVSTFLK